MNHRLALLIAMAFTLAPIWPLNAEGTKSSGPAQRATSGSTLVVSGSEFFIVDIPPTKEKSGLPKKKLPIVVVVVFWIVAMFLWQLYFNYKHKK
jgi:hypothetical protein